MIQIRAARYLDTGKYLVNAARAYGKRTRGSAVTGRHSVSRPTCCKRRCWLIAGCWLNNVVGWYTDCRYRSVRRPPVKNVVRAISKSFLTGALSRFTSSGTLSADNSQHRASLVQEAMCGPNADDEGAGRWITNGVSVSFCQSVRSLRVWIEMGSRPLEIDTNRFRYCARSDLTRMRLKRYNFAVDTGIN